MIYLRWAKRSTAGVIGWVLAGISGGTNPTMTPELAILRHLAGQAYATEGEVAAVLGVPAPQARTFLIVLEAAGLVVSRQDPDTRAPRLVYSLTGEGRRKAGITLVRPT